MRLCWAALSKDGCCTHHLYPGKGRWSFALSKDVCLGIALCLPLSKMGAGASSPCSIVGVKVPACPRARCRRGLTLFHTEGEGGCPQPRWPPGLPTSPASGRGCLPSIKMAAEASPPHLTPTLNQNGGARSIGFTPPTRPRPMREPRPCWGGGALLRLKEGEGGNGGDPGGGPAGGRPPAAPAGCGPAGPGPGSPPPAHAGAGKWRPGGGTGHN